MPEREENIKTLVGLGLNGTQARICLALASMGTSTIREISEASGVARPDTYRAMIELVNRDLVEKTVTSPIKYKLLSLVEVFSVLIGDREKQSLELQEKSTKLLKEYEKITHEQTADNSQFVLIPSEKAFLNRLEKLIDNSQKSICLITSQKVFVQFFANHTEMLEGLRKQVNFKIAIEQRKNNLLTRMMLGLERKTHLDIRYLTVLVPFSLITFDEKEMLVSTALKGVKGKVEAVYSNNSSLVELSQSYFNNAWTSAIEPSNLEFKRSKLQFDYLYANMINGFAYCKMILDDENKPVDFVYLQINEAFEKIRGLKRSQVIGRLVSKVIPGFEKRNPELFEMLSRVCRSGQGEECEIFLKPLNRWYHVSIYSPKKGYFAELFDDITEHKKAEEALRKSEERFRSTLDDMIEGCQIIGNDWRYVYINDAAEKQNRRSKEELMGKRYMDMWPGIQSTKVFTAIKRCMDDKISSQMENEFSFPDGTMGWFDLRIESVPEGVFILSIDITERKKAELEKQEKNEGE